MPEAGRGRGAGRGLRPAHDARRALPAPVTRGLSHTAGASADLSSGGRVEGRNATRMRSLPRAWSGCLVAAGGAFAVARAAGVASGVVVFAARVACEGGGRWRYSYDWHFGTGVVITSSALVGWSALVVGMPIAARVADPILAVSRPAGVIRIRARRRL